MKGKINLREIEKKSWKLSYGDGLWDIFLGLIIINFFVMMFFPETGIFHIDAVYYLMGMTPAFLILILGKIFIINPRIGKVRFSHAKNTEGRKLTTILSMSAIVGMAVFLIIAFGAGTANFGALMFSLNSLIVLSLMGYVMGLRRLYIYGLFLAAAIPIEEFLYPFIGTPLDRVIAFALPGIAITITGFVYLVRFIKKYPK